MLIKAMLVKMLIKAKKFNYILEYFIFYLLVHLLYFFAGSAFSSTSSLSICRKTLLLSPRVKKF